MGKSPPPDETVLLFELKKRYLAVNFIGLGLISTVFLYAALVELVKRGYLLGPLEQPLPASLSSLLFSVFLALAAVIFLFARVLHRRVAAKNPRLLPPIAIAILALSEIPAVLGLMLFLLSRQSMHFYLLMCASLTLFYLFFPRYDQWEQMVLADQKTGAE